MQTKLRAIPAFEPHNVGNQGVVGTKTSVSLRKKVEFMERLAENVKNDLKI